MVLVQEIDASLSPASDAVLVPPTPVENTVEIKEWVTIQQVKQGWWVGVSGPTFLEGVQLDTSGLSVDKLSSYELARSGQKILDFRFLSSALYGDELWLGFEDLTAGDSLGKIHFPYRIVRILPGCVYPSVWDLLNQK